MGHYFADLTKGVGYAGKALITGNTITVMLWLNFIAGLSFIFFCFKLVIIHYYTQKEKKIKFKPRRKLNHNSYFTCAAGAVGWFIFLAC